MAEKVTKTFMGRIKAVDEKNFTVEAVISDESVDRYDEIILAKAWKKRLKTYKKHPVLLTSHSYSSLQSQIGELQSVKVNEKDKTLEAKIKYYVGEGNPEADWGFKLAQKGVAAFSVGFLSHAQVTKWDGDDAMTDALKENDISIKGKEKVTILYTDVELLENSQVVVPANPAALQKSLGKEGDPIIRHLAETVLKTFSKEDVEEKLETEKTVDEVIEEIVDEDIEKMVKKFVEEEIDDPIEIKTVEDAISSGEDVETIVKLIDDIYMKKQAELFALLLEDDSTTKALTEQLKKMVDVLKGEIIDLLNVELELLKDSISSVHIEGSLLDSKAFVKEIKEGLKIDEDLEDKVEDKTDTYISEILGMTNSLKDKSSA